ncbi:MAG: hypothetical protein AAFU71_13540, partial [Cyanobacteria bacterium J06632_22]
MPLSEHFATYQTLVVPIFEGMRSQLSAQASAPSGLTEAHLHAPLLTVPLPDPFGAIAWFTLVPSLSSHPDVPLLLLAKPGHTEALCQVSINFDRTVIDAFLANVTPHLLPSGQTLIADWPPATATPTPAQQSEVMLALLSAGQAIAPTTFT